MIRDYKIYQEMASAAGARNRCAISANNADDAGSGQHWTEWMDRHEDTIKKMLDLLPHGSGIDGDWAFDFVKSGDDKVIFYNSFHAMDENGMYDGWIDFTVTITPSIAYGFHIKITGNFGKRQDIKEYLAESLNWALSEPTPNRYVCSSCREEFGMDEWEYILHECKKEAV